METLIIALCAWLAILFLESGYWMIITLLRWAPMLGAGALAGSIARHHGFDPLEALGIGIVTCLVLRHALRTRVYYLEEGQ